ncbi:MAG: hypothetical protein NTZ17_11955 [Phycisphaerae bacterium]|nr:hypothetical protein [Phycisphaerae bacterium]
MANPLPKFMQSLLRPKRADGSPDDSDGGDADPILGRVVVKDFGYSRVLDRLMMYERRIEHSLYRTMGELRKQRLMRETDPPAAGATAEGGGTVCGTEVSSLKSKVSSSHSTLPTSHFTLPTSDEPPGGGTTNVADAEAPSCETKPICRGMVQNRVTLAESHEGRIGL